VCPSTSQISLPRDTFAQFLASRRLPPPPRDSDAQTRCNAAPGPANDGAAAVARASAEEKFSDVGALVVSHEEGEGRGLSAYDLHGAAGLAGWRGPDGAISLFVREGTAAAAAMALGLEK